MAAYVLIETPDGERFTSDKVVGHVLVAVIRGEDGSLAIERLVGVNINDHPEDGETVSAFVKGVEQKLNEALPEPEPEPKIWVPA